MVRSVYLVRHGPAGHYDPTRWPDDRDRPLTPDGIASFRRAARGLRVLVPEVDAVLASRLARAWQTAELLHEEAGWPEPEPCEALEPGHSLAAVVDELCRHDGSVALVGHEPTFSRLASLLCTGSDAALRIDVKKGSVLLLDVEVQVEVMRATLRWVLPPKALRALAG